MCVQCAAGAMTAATAVTGARAWLGTRRWGWCTDRRLKALTVALAVGGTLAAAGSWG